MLCLVGVFMDSITIAAVKGTLMQRVDGKAIW